MRSMLVAAFEEAFRTLARECHRSASDRGKWIDEDPENRSEHMAAAFTIGSLAQALERSADHLDEHNEEIMRGFFRSSAN